MLDHFVIANRDAIIALAQARVVSRSPFQLGEVTHDDGIPVFLDQLGDALRLAKRSDTPDHLELGKSAARHGLNLFRSGLTIAQVVHDYGDICQSITELAIDQKYAIDAGEFRTLNLCLDDAIARAVTEYSHQHELALAENGSGRLGVLANELCHMLDMATLAFESIRSGLVAPSGSTSVMLGRSLMGLRDLIDRSLAEVRLDAGTEYLELISVAEFIEEVEIGAVFQAQSLGLHFVLAPVDRTVFIEGDRQILAAALANLLQNAFKFTRRHSSVSLMTHVTEERVLFEVADQCGGLPPGEAEELLRPFKLGDVEQRRIGKGLSVCLKAAKANAGELRVRNLPGEGCVFTLDLPRKAEKRPPPLSLVNGAKRSGPRSSDRASAPRTGPRKL